LPHQENNLCLTKLYMDIKFIKFANNYQCDILVDKARTTWVALMKLPGPSELNVWPLVIILLKFSELQIHELDFFFRDHMAHVH
jgi:hypothetical protein